MGKVRSIEEQKALYEKYKRSSLSTKKFCQENNISTRSIWLWSKKFGLNIIDKTAGNADNKPKSVQGVSDVKFYPIDKLKVPANDTPIKVTLPNGININAVLSKKELDLLLQELIKWR